MCSVLWRVTLLKAWAAPACPAGTAAPSVYWRALATVAREKSTKLSTAAGDKNAGRQGRAGSAWRAGLAAGLVLLAPICHARFCANTQHELRQLARDPGFSLTWVETSMTDGKPLQVAISECDGALFLAFHKAQEGLWAEGAATVCESGDDLEARIAQDRIRLGPAAHWILRQSLGRGASFSLRRVAPGRLRIATPGWSGVFVPLVP